MWFTLFASPWAWLDLTVRISHYNPGARASTRRAGIALMHRHEVLTGLVFQRYERACLAPPDANVPNNARLLFSSFSFDVVPSGFRRTTRVAATVERIVIQDLAEIAVAVVSRTFLNIMGDPAMAEDHRGRIESPRVSHSFFEHVPSLGLTSSGQQFHSKTSLVRTWPYHLRSEVVRQTPWRLSHRSGPSRHGRPFVLTFL